MFYKVANSRLTPIEKRDVLERDVQNLVEENLEELLGLKFVDREFSIENVRFDTLAFDEENNSPIIIEFKKSFEKSLFDQGLEYLNILFSRKADFAVALHKKLGLSPDPDKYAWENARVVFVCGQFSERQKRAISFQGLPIDLYRYAWLENNFFQLEKEAIKREAKLSEFSETIKGGGVAIQKVRSEVKDYGREYHKNSTNAEIWELFEKIEEELLGWEDFEIRYRKLYIGFYSKRSFCVVKLYKSKLQVEFGKQKDGEILEKLPGVVDISGKGWNHAYMFEVKTERDLTELFFVLRKALELM